MMAEAKIQLDLSTEQIETMRYIGEIIDKKDLPIFSVKELKDKLPYLRYHAIYMRLKRLMAKNLIKPVGRGVYTVTDRGLSVINKINLMYFRKK